jgi:hypothetical protein
MEKYSVQYNHAVVKIGVHVTSLHVVTEKLFTMMLIIATNTLASYMFSNATAHPCLVIQYKMNMYLVLDFNFFY